MHARKQLANVIDQLLTDEVVNDLAATTVEDYKKLNDKCDVVIEKIKTRKKKKAKNG